MEELSCWLHGSSNAEDHEVNFAHKHVTHRFQIFSIQVLQRGITCNTSGYKSSLSLKQLIFIITKCKIHRKIRCYYKMDATFSIYHKLRMHASSLETQMSLKSVNDFR